jgi:hypothetical protein
MCELAIEPLIRLTILKAQLSQQDNLEQLHVTDSEHNISSKQFGECGVDFPS